MKVTGYGTAAIAANRANETFRSLKADLAALQGSVGTGRVAESYSGLGAGAATSLSGRATLSAIGGYQANVADAELRLKLMSTGIGQIGTLSAALGKSLAGSSHQSPIGQTSAAISAEDALHQTIALLNTRIGTRYLFAGRATDTEPASSVDLIMNGDGTRAGLKQLVAERKEADAGSDGLGRLALGLSGTAVTLGASAAALPFGMKVASAAATGSGNLTASRSVGPPAVATLSLAGQPVLGDAVTIDVTLPDGTTETLTLTARATATPDGSAFAIGANAADTALNLRTALEAAVRSTSSTALASASTVVATTAFFDGTAATPPLRVAGPPFATATSTVAGTAANTVLWYRGDEGTGSPRETGAVRIGETATVAIGARANEEGFRKALTAFATLAAETFPASDATSPGRYAALADRLGAVIGGNPTEAIQVDLSVANAAIGTASTRLAAAKTQVEDAVAGVENADMNEVATKLLATQTRLQASYQTTATIARLSLVEYL